MAIQITSDIPIPQRISATGALRRLEIGQNAFFTSNDMDTIKVLMSRVRREKRPFRKFVARSEKDGVRVWRES